MATVSLFMEEPDQEPVKDRKIERKKSLDGRMIIYLLDGDYELWIDGTKTLGPATKEIIERRFEALLNPVVTPQQVSEKIKTPEITVQSETFHKCPSCGEDVPDERITLVGVVTCTKCTPQPGKLYGIMDYGHKTGGVLTMTEDPELFKVLKRPINQQR